MLSVSDPDARIVAVLHDVCEDCPGWTFDRLLEEGFSRRVVEALMSVTKRDEEDYEAFIRRSALDPIGRQVKLADLKDNADLSRIAEPTERDNARIAKYRRAMAILDEAEDSAKRLTK